MHLQTLVEQAVCPIAKWLIRVASTYMPRVGITPHFKNENMQQKTPYEQEANKTTHQMKSEYFLRLFTDMRADFIVNGTFELE